jgi:hypothetical protein
MAYKGRGVTRVDRLEEQRRPYWRADDAGGRHETEETEEIEHFQDRHQSFADKVERLLMHLVILGLVALVLVQAFQLYRFNWMVAQEGVPVKEVAAWSEAIAAEIGAEPASAAAAALRLKVMSVSRRSAPDAWLLVDGKAAGHFGTGSVEVQVRPGQVLAVDGSAYREELTFRVVEVTGLAAPGAGAQVKTRGDVQRFGVVKAR